MSPKQIEITRMDRVLLDDAISAVLGSPGTKAAAYLQDLREHLGRARIVESNQVSGSVVTMNSRVVITDLNNGEEMTYTLVFPRAASPGEDEISALAPLGTALLGSALGDTIEIEVPAGKLRYRVKEILFQPERAQR